MKTIIPIFLLISSAAMPGSSADGDQPAVWKSRDYRSVNPAHQVVEPPIPGSTNGPLVEKASVLSAGEVAAVPAESHSAEEALGIATTHFRRGLWESAAEWYIKALEADPASAAAAEGLAMSAFQAGEYHYAYRVGTDLAEFFPGLTDKVVLAANEEISLLLRNSRFEEAGEMIAQFPAEETGLALSREKLKLLKKLNYTQTDIERVRGASPGPIDKVEGAKAPLTGDASFNFIDIGKTTKK